MGHRKQRMHKLNSQKNITADRQKQKINNRELNRVFFASHGTKSKINVTNLCAYQQPIMSLHSQKTGKQRRIVSSHGSYVKI
jgi:hypothetical protein